MLGIFDSGVGGLSVLKEIKEMAPNMDVVYFGDIANAPYGLKTQEELKYLTTQAIEILLERGAENIVSACNSVSVSVAVYEMKDIGLRKFDVVEMVQPTVSALAGVDDNIVLFSTVATKESGIYQKEFSVAGNNVFVVAIQDLAFAIESGVEKVEIRNIIQKTLVGVKKYKPTAISLSCTHYPLVKNIFESVLNELSLGVKIFDPAEEVARKTVDRFGGKGDGIIHFIISKDSEVFRDLAKKYFENTKYTIEVLHKNES